MHMVIVFLLTHIQIEVRKREKEIEDKRKLDEARQQAELIKAKTVVAGPKQIGKIDLNQKAVSEKKTVKAEVITPVNEAIESTSEVIDETHATQYQNLTGPVLTGEIV